MLDLDGFKPVNDQFGHDVGDELLISIASRLTAAVGPQDIVARVWRRVRGRPDRSDQRRQSRRFRDPSARGVPGAFPTRFAPQQGGRDHRLCDGSPGRYTNRAVAQGCRCGDVYGQAAGQRGCGARRGALNLLRVRIHPRRFGPRSMLA
ncbi:MAG: diguanylate cyclase [Ahniella sp.]|nr:diguanylate cyclase [Ahniella sp.]